MSSSDFCALAGESKVYPDCVRAICYDFCLCGLDLEGDKRCGDLGSIAALIFGLEKSGESVIFLPRGILSRAASLLVSACLEGFFSSFISSGCRASYYEVDSAFESSATFISSLF